MDLAAGVLHGPAPSPPLPLQLPSPREPGPLHSLPAMLSRHELSSPATGHSLWMLMLSSPRWPPRWPMGISVHPVPPSPVGCPCPAGLVPTTLAPGHSTNCEEGLPAPPRPKPSLLLPQSLAAPQVRPPPDTHTGTVSAWAQHRGPHRATADAASGPASSERAEDKGPVAASSASGHHRPPQEPEKR